VTVAPYGSWTSPIAAADLAASGHPVGGGAFVGEELWWLELRPSEGGRQAIRRLGPDGPTDVLPAPWNARTRVHEYGGGSWTALADGTLIFTEFTDQRLYALDPDRSAPRPLTPEGPYRYAEPQLSFDGGELWCVRETHAPDGGIVRDLCAVPLSGSAATDPALVRSVVGGSDFLAQARISPDGRKLAWIAWDHPQMPWDGTELRVGELTDGGVCKSWQVLAGSRDEAVLQPEWACPNSLFLITDRSGWWNLCRADLAGELTELCPYPADFAGPMWQLGARWYCVLDDGRLLTVRTFGSDSLGVLDPADGTLTDVPVGDLAMITPSAASGTRVLLSCAGARTPAGIRLLELSNNELSDVRLSVDGTPAAAYLPDVELMSFTGPDGRAVHAVVYPPSNPDFTAPDGELPPYVVDVHGGPTTQVWPVMRLGAAYFTSRGIGVLEVNYGGSTGYGRPYRDRLRGNWGVVDVEDTVTAAAGLVSKCLADGDRLVITGASAGGFTVLAALTGTSTFACGSSHFGVADLMKLHENTHDFESQYLTGLIGPLPEAAELYRSRSPLHNIGGLSCPVLLLQGLLDPVVPPEQAELFRDALIEKGIPHAYLAFPDESHGFRQAPNQIAAQEAELSFYGQVLGFTPPGVPVLKLWRP
jgi:dipeptidyl aminopeptidase/acylaminoacyl peptidase